MRAFEAIAARLIDISHVSDYIHETFVR